MTKDATKFKSEVQLSQQVNDTQLAAIPPVQYLYSCNISESVMKCSTFSIPLP